MSKSKLPKYKSRELSKSNIDRLYERIELAEEEKRNNAIALKYLEKEIIIKNDSKNEIEQEIIDLEVVKQDQNIEIQNLSEQINQMQNSIEFIKKKIDLCKNLEFLTQDDFNSYVNILDQEEEIEKEGFLHFENDLFQNYGSLAKYIQSYLFFSKNLVYTEFQIQNFLTLLRTNDLIVLSGLSGSGKTQIIKSFAEAIGGVAKIIPVKPNWTSSDDLLGYYNPIQSSFLPTPFTEAIIEASQNPNQIYLICLDEMNLARVEYYFADFLSKLEEREVQPQIELYAQHEEELFLSEFKTLLNIIESSMSDYKITSWRDFLNNDTVRERFFAMLGNAESDSTLSIHAKMKRRLLDILKFPSVLKIPNNVRFIGAINVDETTNYFSPKVLDRIHLVRFENPLKWDTEIIEQQVSEEYNSKVYLYPNDLGLRSELPKIDKSFISKELKEINNKFLDELNIDFGIRSIRQSLQYANLYATLFDSNTNSAEQALNIIFMQKVLPRFSFDSQEGSKNDKKKIDIAKDLQAYIQSKMPLLSQKDNAEYREGTNAFQFLQRLINKAEKSNGLINFWG